MESIIFIDVPLLSQQKPQATARRSSIAFFGTISTSSKHCICLSLKADDPFSQKFEYLDTRILEICDLCIDRRNDITREPILSIWLQGTEFLNVRASTRRMAKKNSTFVMHLIKVTDTFS